MGGAALTEVKPGGLPEVHVAHAKVPIAVRRHTNALAGVLPGGEIEPVRAVPLVRHAPHIVRQAVDHCQLFRQLMIGRLDCAVGEC